MVEGLWFEDYLGFRVYGLRIIWGLGSMIWFQDYLGFRVYGLRIIWGFRVYGVRII